MHGPRWLNTLFSSAERTQARPRLPCDICGSPARPFSSPRELSRERQLRRRAFIGRVRRKDMRATCTYVLPFFYFGEGPVLPTKVAGHWKVEGNPLPTRRNVPVCTASVAVGARGLGGIRGPLKLPGNRKVVLLLPFLTTPQRSRGCQIFSKRCRDSHGGATVV